MLKKFLVIIFISLATFLQSAPLRITITEGVVEPLPYAAPAFIGETGASNELANKITELIKKAESIMGTIDGALFAAYPRSKQWGSSIENLKLKYINEDLANQLGSAIYFSKEILETFKKNKK